MDRLSVIGSINQFKKLMTAYNLYTDFDYLMIPHYAELTLAWMETLEDTNVLEKYEESSSTSENSQYASIFVRVHCHVDVTVYHKGSGTVMAEIEGDKATNYDFSSVVCWVDNAGTKVFCIPTEYDVIFNLTATDDGTMTVVVTAEDILDGTILRETAFEELELINGQQQIMELTAGFEATDYDVEPRDYDDFYLLPDVERYENELEYFNVIVAVEGYGTAISKMDVLSGEPVCLRAQPFEKNKFLGWYDSEGELVSDQQDMILTVSDNMTFTAKFTENEQSSSSPIALYIGIGVATVAIVTVALALLKKKKSH